jgi:hypothetical protein
MPSEKIHSESLLRAAGDLRYLLGRGYPRPGALTFVGNHHQLGKTSREVLARGVFDEAAAQARRKRLIPASQVAGRPLSIDGHNVIITLESAVEGLPLVEADDGLIRDIAGRHGSYRPGPVTEKVLVWLCEALVRLRPARVLFLLDEPLSHSRDLAQLVSAGLTACGLEHEARAVPVPETELVSFEGPVATSDSALIDDVAEPFDLAGFIIRGLNPPPALIRLWLKPETAP